MKSELIKMLRRLSVKEKVNIWKRVAQELEKPVRRSRKVNFYKINKYVREGETAIVPGKILSEGEIEKKIVVAAWQFSEKATEKINKKGKAISINELIKKNPKGKKVRIIC